MVTAGIVWEVERCAREDVIQIHMNFELPKMSIYNLSRDTPPAKRLRERLQKLEGVENVWSTRYSLHVEKGRLFSIDPLVMIIVQTVAAWGKDEEQIKDNIPEDNK